MTAVLAPAGLLDAPGPALADHLATHGPLPPADLAGLAGTAALTARGGLLAALRIRGVDQAARTVRRAPVVVADGVSGEPAALGDRELLTRAPHLVLDGLALAGRALGATTLLLAAPPEWLPAPAGAVAERGDAVRLHAVAPSALAASGEDAALVSALQGRAVSADQPPVRVSGFGGRPTLVLDVETLARLALLARGCTAAAGAVLVTRRWEAGGVARTDVVDADPGTRLAELLPLGGVHAVLVGGGSGTWVPAAVARGLDLDGADLAAAGRPGAGLLAALPGDRCGLRETARVVAGLADGPAARCAPCAAHLSRVAGALAAPAPPPPGLLDGAATGHGQDACRHLDGAVRLVAGALEVFAGEVTAHRYGSCTATAWAPFLPVPPPW